MPEEKDNEKRDRSRLIFGLQEYAQALYQTDIPLPKKVNIFLSADSLEEGQAMAKSYETEKYFHRSDAKKPYHMWTRRFYSVTVIIVYRESINV